MFLVFSYLEEIAKKNYFESSLDERCMQCRRRKQPHQGEKPKSRMEQKWPGDTHTPHRAQRQHQQPQTQHLPLSTANSGRGQCWSPSHRVSPGTQGTAGARITCKAHTGSGVWHRDTVTPAPQTTPSCPMADPSPCSQQSPKAAAIKPWAHPGRANTRHNQALAQDGPWGTQSALPVGREPQTPKPAVAAPELLSKHNGVSGKHKAVQNREGEAFRQTQGTHGAEKCREMP